MLKDGNIKGESLLLYPLKVVIYWQIRFDLIRSNFKSSNMGFDHFDIHRSVARISSRPNPSKGIIFNAFLAFFNFRLSNQLYTCAYAQACP